MSDGVSMNALAASIAGRTRANNALASRQAPRPLDCAVALLELDELVDRAGVSA